MASSASSSSAAAASGCYPSSWRPTTFRPRLFPHVLFGIDTEHSRDDQAAQIFDAAMRGDIPRMKRLAERRRREGKSVEVVEEIRDNQNRRLGALHVAAFCGQLKMCKFLIKDLHLNVNAVAQHGSMYFAGVQLLLVTYPFFGRKKELLLILTKCLSYLVFSLGSSPLICAIYGSAPAPTVKFLLDRGADPNISDREGFTVLHVVATKQDFLGIAHILLSRGANVDAMSEYGTPLHCAAQCGNVEMMELLLNCDANPNKVVRLFYAPMTLALFASSLKCVELLIKAGADVNAGRPVTPLVVAAMDGLTDCIKCLLEANADPNIPNEFGRMPVEIAAICGWKECVEILFPVTSHVARFADWSVYGITQHVKSSQEPASKALGDAAFERKDYAHASALYTKAMETDPKDSNLYAKRSLCWLHMGEKEKSVDDANTCKDMGLDVSNCCNEQGAALILAGDYRQACKALISSLKLDSGSGPVGEVAREEDNK